MKKAATGGFVGVPSQQQTTREKVILKGQKTNDIKRKSQITSNLNKRAEVKNAATGGGLVVSPPTTNNKRKGNIKKTKNK